VGLYPDFLMDREKARRRSRVERLPADHPFRSDFADTPTKTGLAYIRRQRASGPSPDGNRVAWGLGRGLVSLQTPRKGAGYPSQL